MDERRRDPGTVLAIACECGFVIKGEVEVELLANARNHLDEAHPEDRAKFTDEDLLAEAEVQPAP